MIPKDILPYQQEILKKRAKETFWKSSQIVDYVQRGVTTYALGKLKFSPEEEEYRIWKSDFGLIPPEEPQYLGVYHKSAPALGAFSEIIQNFVKRIRENEPPAPGIKRHAALIIHARPDDELESDKSFIDFIDEIYDKRKDKGKSIIR